MRATKLLGALLTAATFCITTDANAADHLALCTDVLKECHARVETLIRQAAPDDTVYFHDGWLTAADFDADGDGRFDRRVEYDEWGDPVSGQSAH